MFVQQSGCFGLVNRGRSMQSRKMERTMADHGELQEGSNLGKTLVKAADYFLEPKIVTANRHSGGGAGALLGGISGAFGGWGSAVGAIVGGSNVQMGEATGTLSIVNARTTEEEALTQGYAHETDWSWCAGGGGFAGGYRDTAVGQVILLANLDTYAKLVTQLGGLPANAAAAASQAK
jgi:hypothetical protein